MKQTCFAFVIASVFCVAALLGLAWAASVEEELKKLETDRAAAVVKGDVATLEKQTSDDYTLINLYGQISDKSKMVDTFKSGQIKLTQDNLSDMKVRVYGNVAVITGKADVAYFSMCARSGASREVQMQLRQATPLFQEHHQHPAI